MKRLPHTGAASTARRWIRSSMILVALGMLASGCGMMPTLSDPATTECQLPEVPPLPPREPDGAVILEPSHQAELLILFDEVDRCRDLQR